MKILPFICMLFLISCQQAVEKQENEKISHKRKLIIPEPFKIIIPADTTVRYSITSFYYNTGVDVVHDTLPVKEIALDTAKLFIYRYQSDNSDTLLITRHGAQYRANRDWGQGETKYCGQKTFVINGKRVKVQKIFIFWGRYTLGNVFYNESLGRILSIGIAHPHGNERYVYYNPNVNKKLHDAIMNDTIFSKFDLALD